MQRRSGSGLPAACDVALAERDLGTNRKVISLQGDRATQYAIEAFWNTAQRKPSQPEYCILESFSEYLVAANVPGFDLPGIDTVQLAKGCGCDGDYVSKPAELEAAIKKGPAAKVLMRCKLRSTLQCLRSLAKLAQRHSTPPFIESSALLSLSQAPQRI